MGVEQIAEIDSIYLAREHRILQTPLRQFLHGWGNTLEVIPSNDMKCQFSDLVPYLYLPGDSSTSDKIPLPKVELDRGRESGAVIPVCIADETGYKSIGIITIKGFGLRQLSDAKYFKPHSNDTNPIVPGLTFFDEAFLEKFIGDALAHTGMHIGRTLATLRLPLAKLQETYRSMGPEGISYASILDKIMCVREKDAEKFVSGTVRLTDPARLDPNMFELYRKTSEDVFAIIPENLDKLISSYLWLKHEFDINGKEKFLKRYRLLPDQIKHFENDEMLYSEIGIAQAELLVHIITMNFGLALKSPFTVWFDPKDIGCLGKQHDFAISMDFLGNPHNFTISSFRDLIRNTFYHGSEHSAIQASRLRELINQALRKTNTLDYDYDSIIRYDR